MQPGRVENNAAPAPGTSWVLLLSIQITPHPCSSDSCLSAFPLVQLAIISWFNTHKHMLLWLVECQHGLVAIPRIHLWDKTKS